MRNKTIKSLAYFVARYLFLRPFMVARADRYGLQLKFKTEDVIGRHIFKYGTHEDKLTQYLLDNLRIDPGDVILDVGANIGWYSLLFDKSTPDGVEIFAFEPDPLNFSLLKQNIEANRAVKVTPIQKALSDSATTLPLYRYRNKNLGRHSLLPINGNETVDVPTTTINQFLDEFNVQPRRVKFVKADVEGYEFKVFRGASRLLTACPMFLIELSPYFMAQGGIDPRDLVTMFADADYQAGIIEDEQLRPVDPEHLQHRDANTNVLWTKKSA